MDTEKCVLQLKLKYAPMVFQIDYQVRKYCSLSSLTVYSSSWVLLTTQKKILPKCIKIV